MKNNVAVVCFLWGDWPVTNGKNSDFIYHSSISDLAESYIRCLFNGLYNNTLLTYDFIVITDKFSSKIKDVSNVGINVRLVHLPFVWRDFRWNLKKSFVFDPDCCLSEYEWVVLMDLDMVITGNLDFLLSHRSSSLVTCRGAFTDRIGGSVLGFSPKEDWVSEIPRRLKGDADHFGRVTRGSERKFLSIMYRKGIIPKIDYWQDLYPQSVASYKVDGETEDFSLVRFHGLPRPHQLESEWIRKYWI